jgi:hypothetical protein
MKQNIQNRTYITIRMHKHNNKKYIIYKIEQKHTKHTTIHTIIKKIGQKSMKECGKPKSHINSKLHMTYISPNNGKHPVTMTFTPLH